MKKMILESLRNLSEGDNKQVNYMFFQNLNTIKEAVDNMLNIDPSTIDMIITNGHDWASDHISTSKDDVEEVYNFFKNKISDVQKQ